MSILHGRKVIVKAATGQVAAVAIEKQRSMELTETCEMRETATNTNNSQTYDRGRQGWNLSVSGLMSNLGSTLQVGTLYTLEITDGSVTKTGQAWCSQTKVTATIGNLAQQSAAFQGTGPLGVPSVP